MTDLGRIVVARRTGAEPFHADGSPLGTSLIDFWRWSTSDLVTNTTRGVLAEFLVAQALGVDVSGVRDPWAAFDLTTPGGVSIEVKSGAYLQSWHQRDLTAVQFSCAPSRAWDAGTNTYADEPRRQATCYVFALLAHRDKRTLDPLDVSQWQYWAVATERLNERLKGQQSLSLAALQALAGDAVGFAELGQAVANAVSAAA